MNCIIIEDDPFSQSILEAHIEKIKGLSLVHVFNDAVSAIKAIEELNVQLIFLDIEMPGMTGLEFLEELMIEPRIIITSGNKEHAFEVVQQKVDGFLFKPIEFVDFKNAIEEIQDKIRTELETPLFKEYLFVKNSGIIEKIAFKDILFIEAKNEYVQIQTTQKSHLIFGKISSVHKRVPDDYFARVHRSYIVNCAKIDQIDSFVITMNDYKIPVSKTYKSNLFKKLNLL